MELTSSLKFTLLDEKFDSQKTTLAISLSFVLVILNCLLYLIVLNGMDRGAPCRKCYTSNHP